MANYLPGKEPPCPMKLPGCLGIIKSRQGTKCRNCADTTVSHARHVAGSTTPTPTPHGLLEHDRQKHHTDAVIAGLKDKYAEAIRTIERQESELGWLTSIRAGINQSFAITPKESSGTSEATPVLLASDWHSEEIVKLSQTSGLNEFNPTIADKRIRGFFQGSLRLIRLLNQDVKISTVVLGLLGDFITNDIHDAENAESNAMLPIDAIIAVQNKIIAGIEFFLNHSQYSFVIPCKVGNHSRTTKKVRMASESGHSLESLMYVHLAAYFRDEPRVTFVIDEGYHTYLNIYDYTVRLHHGHAVQYGGGIGGLFIPAYKAIAQWSKARHADVDVFGHFHQTKDGGNFLCNGSLIGYNAFALRIKADYEPPRQTLFLIDKKRGRTCTWPIILPAK